MEIYDRRGDGGKVRLMFQDKAGFGRIDKRPFSRSKTCCLRTFPHSACFCAMMRIQQKKHRFKGKTIIRHIYYSRYPSSDLAGGGRQRPVRQSGVGRALCPDGAAFGYAACAAWKKRGK